MDLLDALDPVIRGGAIALFALWTALFLRDHRQIVSARVAIAMNLSILAYLVAGMFAFEGPRHPLYVVCDAVSVMVPALFWLFARLWFDDRRRIGWRSWALLLGFALMPLAQAVIVSTTGQHDGNLWIIVRAAMFAFALGGMWIAWRGRENDLVEPRRAFRLMLVGAIGGFTLWVTFLEMFRTRDMNHELGRSVTLAAILLSTFVVSVALYRFRSAELFGTPGAARSPARGANAAEPSPLAQRLNMVMAEERAYRAEGFSLTALAMRLAEPEYRVRRTINGEMGFRNFTAFLNSFRLDEVRAALTDPEQRAVPILTIALDAGFGSLGPFNRAFREAEGMTPSEYRKPSA